MRLLVTGGCGFIGTNFVRHIFNTHKDISITNLDKLTYCGKRENLMEFEKSSRYEFVKGDICNVELVKKLMKKAEVVINFAAETHVDRSIEKPAIFIKTNILGTQTLLQAALNSKIKKFIHISTDETYGSLVLNAKDKFTENTPLQPNSPYAASKAGSDLLARSYFKTYGLPTIITRCSNNYGPYQFPEKLIPLSINRVLKNQPIQLYGDGKNIRDWISVFDHSTAVETVLEKGKAGEIYNIGANTEKSNLEIAQLILKILGKPLDQIKFTNDRLGHDRRYAINAKKIQQKLKWKPQIKFEEGLIKTIEWYKKCN